MSIETANVIVNKRKLESCDLCLGMYHVSAVPPTKRVPSHLRLRSIVLSRKPSRAIKLAVRRPGVQQVACQESLCFEAFLIWGHVKPKREDVISFHRGAGGWASGHRYRA